MKCNAQQNTLTRRRRQKNTHTKDCDENKEPQIECINKYLCVCLYVNNFASMVFMVRVIQFCRVIRNRE